MSVRTSSICFVQVLTTASTFCMISGFVEEILTSSAVDKTPVHRLSAVSNRTSPDRSVLVTERNSVVLFVILVSDEVV